MLAQGGYAHIKQTQNQAIAWSQVQVKSTEISQTPVNLLMEILKQEINACCFSPLKVCISLLHSSYIIETFSRLHSKQMVESALKFRAPDPLSHRQVQHISYPIFFLSPGDPQSATFLILYSWPICHTKPRKWPFDSSLEDFLARMFSVCVYTYQSFEHSFDFHKKK